MTEHDEFSHRERGPRLEWDKTRIWRERGKPVSSAHDSDSACMAGRLPTDLLPTRSPTTVLHAYTSPARRLMLQPRATGGVGSAGGHGGPVRLSRTGRSRGRQAWTYIARRRRGGRAGRGRGKRAASPTCVGCRRLRPYGPSKQRVGVRRVGRRTRSRWP
jgi:hypothetical protein